MECKKCGAWVQEEGSPMCCPACGAKTVFFKETREKVPEAKPAAPKAEEKVIKKPFFEQLKDDLFKQELFMNERPLVVWAFVGLVLSDTLFSVLSLIILIGLIPEMVQYGAFGIVLEAIFLGIGVVVITLKFLIIWMAWIYKKHVYYGAVMAYLALYAISSGGIGWVGIAFLVALGALAYLVNREYPQWVEKNKVGAKIQSPR
ncbi:MAG: hypothetical protein NT157_00360 [Candidatus Micrarchaeota archaeon]|nr:hypothetical protein [Candidatus Micrarchaeota archaeon]